MTDYRFSSERPGKKLRLGLGTIVPYTTASLAPIPSVLGPWSEPTYTAQTREYAESRMPVFLRKLDTVAAETDRLVALYRSRMSAGIVQGSGEQAFVSMPVTGPCPQNGPLYYVYDDIFAAAQANLATLGGEKPPRWSSVDVITRWASLIWMNVEILQRASNIDERFWFPDTVSRFDRRTFDEFTGGSGRTLRTTANAPKEGHPYPIDGPRVPQTYLDGEVAIARGFEEALRLTPGVNLAPAACSTAAMSSNPECAAERMARYDRVWNSFSPAPETVGITDARLFPQTTGFTPYAIELLNSMFFTRNDQLGRTVRFGSPRASIGGVQAIAGGAWDKPYSPVFLSANPDEKLWDFTTSRYIPYTGFRAVNPLALLDGMQRLAKTFSRVSLQQIVSEAIGFYVFNHNVWYAEKLGFTVEQLRAQQRAVASAGLDRTSAPILGVVGAVGSAVNPAIGIVIGIVNAIGKELLLNFIQIRPDTPKPLFLRIPDPAVCEGRPEDQAGASLCPAGTTGVYPRCVPIPSGGGSSSESGISLPIVAGASIAALLLLWAAKKRGEEA